MANHDYQEYVDWLALNNIPLVGYRDGFYYNNNQYDAISSDPDKFTNNVNVFMWWLERKLGYCHASACAIIGNSWRECGCNPAAWEGNQHNTAVGYGLMQWTPAYQFIFANNYAMCCSGKGQMLEFKAEYEVDPSDPAYEWTPPPGFGSPTWEQFRLNQFEVDGETVDDYWDVRQLAQIFCGGYLRGVWDERRADNAETIYNNVDGKYRPKCPIAWLLFKMSKQNRGWKF